jgi:RNA polymerase sigma factor (sigma-70 family)
VEEAAAGLDPADPMDAQGEPASEAFDQFVAGVEPGLRRALVAGYGAEVGRDAAVDALVWAWSNWSRVRRMSNPGGYLYRVGQTAARRQLRRGHRGRPSMRIEPASGPGESRFEPGLMDALSALSIRQRTAVLLVHGYAFTLSEAATAMGCSPSSVRNHLARALERLRRSLGVEK